MNDISFPKCKLHHVCNVIMGSAPPGHSYNIDKQGLPLVAGAGDFGDYSPKPKTYTTEPTNQSQLGDLLICIRATIGDLNWSDQVYCLGRGVACLRVNEQKLSSKYLSYQLQYSQQDLLNLGTGTTFLQISKQDIRQFNILLPPLETQKKIASYLDRKTEAIDALIAKKQRMIELLEEKRSALINHVVTKGLNPDAPMKDSGIPWIGQIPAHWDVKRVKYALKICNNLRKPINKSERHEMKGDYPYWGPTGVLDFINEYQFDGDFAIIGEDGDHFLKYNRWEMTQWASGKFNVNNHAHVLKTTSKCYARWFYYSFMHRDISDILTLQGMSRLKLTRQDLENLFIFVPSLDEQMKLIEFLEGIVFKFRNTIAKSKCSIQKLQEYRQALITAAVTGKLDVEADVLSDDPEEGSNQMKLF